MENKHDTHKQPDYAEEKSVPSSDLLADIIQTLHVARAKMHAFYMQGQTLENAGRIASAYSKTLQAGIELEAANTDLSGAASASARKTC